MLSHSEEAIQRYYYDYCCPRDYNLEGSWKKNLREEERINRKRRILSFIRQVEKQDKERSTESTFKYYKENILQKGR